MKNSSERSATSLASRFLDLGNGVPWLSLGKAGWQLARNLWQRRGNQGMYEVLDYESTLELLDPRGARAHFKKREIIRYLQDNIIAYQDFAWGDGQILLNYRCSPGKVVDRWRPGQTTYVLISLRQKKMRGEIEEFNIDWSISNGFIRKNELWETKFEHRTLAFRTSVIFPAERPPLKVSLQSDVIECAEVRQIAGGRSKAVWRRESPEIDASYIINWIW